MSLETEIVADVKKIKALIDTDAPLHQARNLVSKVHDAVVSLFGDVEEDVKEDETVVETGVIQNPDETIANEQKAADEAVAAAQTASEQEAANAKAEADAAAAQQVLADKAAADQAALDAKSAENVGAVTTPIEEVQVPTAAPIGPDAAVAAGPSTAN